MTSHLTPSQLSTSSIQLISTLKKYEWFDVNVSNEIKRLSHLVDITQPTMVVTAYSNSCSDDDASITVILNDIVLDYKHNILTLDPNKVLSCMPSANKLDISTLDAAPLDLNATWPILSQGQVWDYYTEFYYVHPGGLDQTLVGTLATYQRTKYMSIAIQSAKMLGQAYLLTPDILITAIKNIEHKNLQANRLKKRTMSFDNDRQCSEDHSTVKYYF